MSVYADRFWKKSWDEGLDDLDPSAFESTLVHELREVFDALPDKPALAYLGLEMPFGEFDRHANRFANMLVDRGFRKGDIVGINLPNMPEYLISVVGTIRAGCIVSGVSPLLSVPQIEYQLNDLGAGGERKVALVTLETNFHERVSKVAPNVPSLQFVITTHLGAFLGQEAQGEKPAPVAGREVLDFHGDVLGGHPDSDPGVEVTPDDLGFIQYTGGTTGPPKGAMLSHRNVIANIKSITTWLGWKRGAGRLLSAFPMFHIAGLTIAEAGLYVGWMQVLIPNPRDPEHICNELEKYKVNAMVNVPALYQMLMAQERFRKMDHSHLDVCICAASPFPKESQEELESIVGKGKVLELYGMTETSPVSVMNPYKAPRKLGKVGVPFLNVEAKLVDPTTGEEVPIGTAGEICIKGPIVMQGYYNKPEETKKAIDEDGYMHTGDVGVMDEDGFIKLVDRTKDMINVGGYKVFSRKVEEVLAKHPAIQMVALVGIPNPKRPGSELVKAFVQVDPSHAGQDPEALKEDIVRFAKENCAPYEVPKEIEILPELPLTTVGKIDKKVLRKKTGPT